MSAYEDALAEIRALRSPEPATAAPTDRPTCCTGDRRGYQWHQRTGQLPACEQSLAAQRAYSREYLREWRKRRRSRAGDAS